MNFRQEKDAIGKIDIPADAYYGSFTTRAHQNFQLSNQKASEYFRQALGYVKKAACHANTKLSLLTQEQSHAILQAADEFIAGQFNDQFTLDIFQAGAGTPFNMNSNEIIANRANEILGHPKGSYAVVHPNNHVNMGQSSNDVIPTTIRLANILYFQKELIPAFQNLIQSIQNLANQNQDVLKVGRTHLEDAVPITLGQELEAMAIMLQKSLAFATQCEHHLHELGIGGTATGTGITTEPEYQGLVVEFLKTETGIQTLIPTANLMETNANAGPFGIFSSGLRSLANDIIKISNDLKLLNMGPKAGIAEIILEEVEPGSSIMPGKVNPSIVEASHMTACQVIGNDTAVQLGVQAGQLQLNVMTPLILFNLEFSQTLLKNTADMLIEFCFTNMIIDKERIPQLVDGSLIFATALVPYLGYPVIAEIVHQALHQQQSLTQAILAHQLVSEEILQKLLDPAKITKPAKIDTALRDQIQASENYQAFKTKYLSV